MLFEVSWEVCNKVGGIHTVITSKAEIITSKVNNYFCIGPYFNQSEKVFKPLNSDNYKDIFSELSNLGVNVHYGEWQVPGKPKVFLLDFKGLFGNLNEYKTMYWDLYKIDSLYTNYGFEEPLIFSTAAGLLIEKLTDKALVHCHEWMTGFTNLYLKSKSANYKTVFTAHATVLGRSLSGSGEDVYENVKNVNADEKAKSLNVIDKHSAEKAAANYSDIFTTVSRVTSKECESFLGKKPDFILSNGLDIKEVRKSIKNVYRKDVENFTKLIFQNLNVDKAKFFFTSGRYEYRSKGWDYVLDSLKELNDKLKSEKSNKNLVFMFLIAVPNNGVKEEIIRLKNKEELEPPLVTHHMHDDFMEDEVKKRELYNKRDDPVKVIIYPSYLNGEDDLISLNYEDFIQGFDLGVFPSYYEPYGYTPLETSSLGIPSVTSVYSGFGDYMKDLSGKGIFVISDKGSELTNIFYKFLSMTREEQNIQREQALKASERGDWNNLIKLYYKAYNEALEKKTF